MRNDRANPSRRSAAYLVLKSLADDIKALIKSEGLGGKSKTILDVGCGNKPYEHLFDAHYIGLDLDASGRADIIGNSTQLPFENEKIDGVVSFQVLEHVMDPVATLKEIHRILKPGGYCLLSTHGTYMFHPSPKDYWRWTHQGLEKIFTDSGFDKHRIIAQGGTGSCLCYLIATYLSFISYRMKWLKPVVWLGVPLLNFSGPLLDNFFCFLNHPNSFSLTSNYLIYSRKRLAS